MDRVWVLVVQCWEMRERERTYIDGVDGVNAGRVIVRGLKSKANRVKAVSQIDVKTHDVSKGSRAGRAKEGAQMILI